MKRTFIVSLALAASAASFAQVNYNFQGVWPDGKGKTVTLGVKHDRDVNNVDSAVVAADGTFSIKGQTDRMKEMVLGYNGRADNVFIAGQPVINVEISKKMSKNRAGEDIEVSEAKIEGGKDQAVYDELTTAYMTKSLYKLGFMLAMSKNSEDSLKLDSINTAFTAVINGLDSSVVKTIKSNTDVYATPYFINNVMLSDLKLDELRGYYDALSDRVKASDPGKDLKESIERLARVNVGGIAPDFTLTTPDGKKVSLSQFRGKVVLLDFWATWCGPCLREMPNVISIYKKYHSKGLEILGVSLDEEKSADKWRQMIKDRGMDWNHGSSLQGWDCPVAKMFNVTAIPRMYIIDKDGKIIAQDLRGEALANKMAEIFK